MYFLFVKKLFSVVCFNFGHKRTSNRTFSIGYIYDSIIYAFYTSNYVFIYIIIIITSDVLMKFVEGLLNAGLLYFFY